MVQGADIDSSLRNCQNEVPLKPVSADNQFRQMQLKGLPVQKKENGIIVANPPYRDRLLSEEQAQAIYK